MLPNRAPAEADYSFSPFTARAFAELNGAKFIAVFGNNEGEKLFLKSVINSFGGDIYEYCYKDTLGGKRVYMTHTPHNLEEIVASEMYELVIYGHTHKSDIRQEGKTLIVNPGETTDWITGEPQVVILDLASMETRIISLNDAP